MRIPCSPYKAVTIVVSVLLVSLPIAIVTCQNIDTDKPILREVSGLGEDSLFGYSLVLHQTHSNPSNMEEAINGAR